MSMEASCATPSRVCSRTRSRWRRRLSGWPHLAQCRAYCRGEQWRGRASRFGDVGHGGDCRRNGCDPLAAHPVPQYRGFAEQYDAVLGAGQTGRCRLGTRQDQPDFSCANRPGAVVDLIEPLEAPRRVDDASESRPSPDRLWSIFLPDIEGHVSDARVAAALAQSEGAVRATSRSSAVIRPLFSNAARAASWNASERWRSLGSA